MNALEVVSILGGAAICLVLIVFGGITILMVGERITDAVKLEEKKLHKRTLWAFIGAGVVNAALMYAIAPSKWGWGVALTLIVIGAWGWANGIGDEVSQKYGVR